MLTLHPVRRAPPHTPRLNYNFILIGCVLYHYGLTEFKYYTVIFGVSRGLSLHFHFSILVNRFPSGALGCVTQLVWARGTPSFE